jgi:hypothetical protein
MAQKKKVGVLLISKADQSQVGVIELLPEGMWLFRAIKKELHVYALKPVEKYLTDHGFSEPLYVKYAETMRESKEIPEEILWNEAESYAAALNAGKLKVGEYVVKAMAVRYS